MRGVIPVRRRLERKLPVNGAAASVWASRVTPLMTLPLSVISRMRLRLNEARLLIGPLKVPLSSFR